MILEGARNVAADNLWMRSVDDDELVNVTRVHFLGAVIGRGLIAEPGILCYLLGNDTAPVVADQGRGAGARGRGEEGPDHQTDVGDQVLACVFR